MTQLAVIRSFARLLTRRERRLAALLVLVAAVAAVLEAAAVGSTLPFFRLLQAQKPMVPHALRVFVFPLFDLVGVRPRVALGIIVVSLVLISNITSFAATRAQLKAVHLMGHRVAMRLLGAYLALPWERLVQADVAKTSKHVLHDSEQLVTGVLKPLGQIVASGTVVLALLVLLLALSPITSLLALVLLAATYGAVFVWLRRGVHHAGVGRVEANRRRFKVAGEALGGAKEIKVSGTATSFVERFAGASRQYALLTAQQQLLQVTPRFVIDMFAVAGAVSVAVVLAANDRNVSVVLPTLGLFAFAGYRALPHFQQVMSSAMQLRAHMPMLAAVFDDLPDPVLAPTSPARALPFSGEACLEHVTIQYAGRDRPAVSGVSLTIARGKMVAIVGRTGSGKSTIADALLALINPASGRLVVDGTEITESNRAAWQANIGYVPQRIYLADDTILSNIAFGIAPERIDQHALEEASRLAHVDDFVGQLPDGYATIVGERGVRLSGGQQQRIGIARALYRQPTVLILDEATSDLDTLTQSAISASLRRMPTRPAILAIAHRMEAVEHSDTIYVVEGGRVIGKGTYAQLERDIPAFQAMTAAKVESGTG